jgi:hypothetical protein
VADSHTWTSALALSSFVRRLGAFLPEAVARFPWLWPAVVAHVLFNLEGLLLAAVVAGS